LNPRPLRPELRAGRLIGVISAGRRPLAAVLGRCWLAPLLYFAAVQRGFRVGPVLAMHRRNRLGAGGGSDGDRSACRWPGSARPSGSELSVVGMGHGCLSPELVVPARCVALMTALNSGIRWSFRQQESNFSGMLTWPSSGWGMTRACCVHLRRGLVSVVGPRLNRLV
jgi:hypothetical protein